MQDGASIRPVDLCRGSRTERRGVAILMNGGPASMNGPRAYQAFQDFTAKDTTAAKEFTTAQDVTAARS